MSNRKLVQSALFISLALILQALRLLIPLSQAVSTFVIGTLVHMMLVLTMEFNGLRTALLLGFLLPLIAYLQGQMLLVFLIPVVWLGNTLFSLLLYILSNRKMLMLCIPPLFKAGAMAVASWGLMSIFDVNSVAVRNAVLFAMSVPQLVTAVLGTAFAGFIKLRLRRM